MKQRYDGKVPVIIVTNVGRRGGSIMVRAGKGKTFRAIIFESEVQEINDIEKRISPLFLVGTYDVNAEGILSPGETMALLLTEIEFLSSHKNASSKFCQVVIDMDPMGNYHCLLIDEQGNRRKLGLGVGIIVSKYLQLELVAKKDLFENRKPPLSVKKEIDDYFDLI